MKVKLNRIGRFTVPCSNGKIFDLGQWPDTDDIPAMSIHMGEWWVFQYEIPYLASPGMMHVGICMHHVDYPSVVGEDFPDHWMVELKKGLLGICPVWPEWSSNFDDVSNDIDTLMDTVSSGNPVSVYKNMVAWSAYDQTEKMAALSYIRDEDDQIIAVRQMRSHWTGWFHDLEIENNVHELRCYGSHVYSGKHYGIYHGPRESGMWFGGTISNGILKGDWKHHKDNAWAEADRLYNEAVQNSRNHPITLTQIKKFLGHNPPSCRVRVTRDGEVHRTYGRKDKWELVGTVDDIRHQIMMHRNTMKKGE